MSALPTLTALRASSTSAALGQSLTLTATVGDLSPGGATPNGGTVTFSDAGGALGSETLANGVAAFTTSSLPAGANTVTASYSGSAGFAPSTTGTIVTAAGNGKAGYAGNDGPATAAELHGPSGMAFDSAGDLFFAEYYNDVVREVVKATGDIITVAGNGTAGYSGVNGPATAAELNKPIDVAVDSAGDLFIADLNNNRIREVVKATSDIITVAGNGTAGYSGDGGPATGAELNGPRGVAFDSAGDLFFADGANNVIREVVKATGDIITVAGNGTAGYRGDNGPATAAELDFPYNAAVDSAGDLFIADLGNNVIREVVKATGDIITLAGNGTAGYSGDNGPATDAELNDAQGVAVDSLGNVFIADQDNYRIREVVKATGDIITVAGNGTAGYSGDNGPATDAELFGGRVAVDSAGDVFINNFGSNVVCEFTTSVTVTVGPSSALPTLTALIASTASAIAGASVTFTASVSDLSAGGATPNGGTVTFSDQSGAIGSETLADGVAEFTTSSLAAGKITVTASYGGTTDFAASSTGTIVTAVGNGTPGYTGNNGPATAAELSDPYGLAIDSAGDLFIADYENNVVREVVKATGDIIIVAGNGKAGYSGDNGLATAAELDHPAGLAIDPAGDLLISDSGNNVVREVVKATGDIIIVAGNGKAGYSGDNGPATAAKLDNPRGLAIDSAGDLLIADANNNVVREVVEATGDIITVAGNGIAGYSGDNGPATAARLDADYGAAVDAPGDLFIADGNNNAVREVVKATGDIITVAGNGTAGYSGDYGPATDAELDGDYGLGFDSAGDLFIADTLNNVVREVVKATGDIITVAGNGTAGYSGDNGPATAAELDFPSRVTVHAAGDVFIADNNNNVVREVTPAVTVTISAATATYVVFGQQPTNATAGAAVSPAVTIKVEDAFGNVVTTDNSTVTLTLSSGVFQGGASTATAAAVGGIATFSNLKIDAAGSYTLSATDATLTASGASNSFTISPAAPFQIVIHNHPSSAATAGQPLATGPLVYELDQYGNLESGDNTTVVTASLNTGIGPLQGTLTATVVGGIATFSNLFDQLAETISINFMSGTLTEATSNIIVVSPAATSQLVMEQQPSPTAPVGQSFSTQPVIYEEDQYGNLEKSDNTTLITAMLNSGIGPLAGTTTVTVLGGVAGFTNLSDSTAETITLKFTNSTLTSLPSNAVVVSPTTTGEMLIHLQPSSTATAGQAFAVQPVIYLEDSSGSLLTSDNTSVVTVSLASGNGTLQGTKQVTASGGVATFVGLSDNTAGVISLSFSGAGLTAGPSTKITVGPAAPFQLVIHTQPSAAATAGQPLATGPVVYEEDQYGNLETGDNSTVITASLASGNGPLRGTTTATLSGGVATFGGLFDDVAGIISLNFAGAGSTAGPSNNIFISTGPAAKLVIQTPPFASVTAGNPLTDPIVIDEVDQYGNIETGDNSTVVTASLNSGAGSLNGARTATVTAGVASFNDLEDNTAGTLSLKFATGTLPPVVSSPSTVKAAPATQLVVTTAPPNPIVAGQAFVLVVAAEDQFNNVDTTYSGNVTISLPTAPRVVVTVPVKNGLATFSGLTLPTTAQSGTIQATASGLSATNSSPVRVTPPEGSNTPPPSPTIIGESVVMMKKTNKKGKTVGKAVFEGFKLVFSTAMNPSTAGLPGNYSVDSMTIKREKKKNVPVFKPVTINKVVYSQSNNIDSVTLTLKSATPFAKGGRITIINTLPNGVSSAAGGLLNDNDTVFTILPKAKGITLA